MKIYLVGGAVRDKLLGLPVKEKDWVVVGASEDDMLKQGYQRVGKEFPVFLHPKTRDEYALARMERKTAPGYKGFKFDASPNVTLEEDLIRRDLTINAMAEDEDGNLYDPYHGKADLDKKILRHVSAAFKEDPVRILRIGRFLARYAALGFTVADETNELMKEMVRAGEVNALVAERVWKELERALGESNPEKFFAVLEKCHALAVLFPGLNMNGRGIDALIAAATFSPDPAVRLAALLHDYGDELNSLNALCKRYRIPNHHQQLAKLVALHFATAASVKSLQPDQIVDLFARLDIYRREQRFEDFLLACQAVAMAKSDKDFDIDWLHGCADAVNAVSVQKIIKEGYEGTELAARIREERIKAISAFLSNQ